jgi:MFS family permease
MPILLEYARHFGRFQRNARLYLISNALSGVTTGILLLLYNLYLISLGFNASFIGIVLFTATIGGGLAIFPAGLCIDRYSGKWILIWSNLLIGIAGVGQILFRQPVPLLVSGFVAGVGLAFVLVINSPFLTNNSLPEERPYLFSLNIFLLLITSVLGSLIGGILPELFRASPFFMAPLPSSFTGMLAASPNPRSYQLSLLLAGTIAAPSFIPFFLMTGDKPKTHAPDVPQPDTVPDIHEPDTHKGCHYITSSRCNVVTSLVGVRLVDVRQMGLKISKLVRNPMFLLTVLQVFFGFGAGLFTPYFNIFFVQHLKASPALFGLISAAGTAVTALMTIAAPWLATRLGRVPAIVLTQLASLPLLVLMGFVPFLTLVIVLFLFQQGFGNMENGVLQVFSMEAISERRRGLANSSYQAGYQVASAVAAPVGGFIITLLGYAPLFIGGAFCYLLAIGLLWGSFGRRKARIGNDSLPHNC